MSNNAENNVVVEDLAPVVESTVRTNEELNNVGDVRRFIREFWNNGNEDVADEFLAPNSVMHLPSGDIMGPAEFKEHAAGMRKIFDNIRFSTGQTIAEGNRVVIQWSVFATHVGEFAGVAATNKETELEGTSIIQFYEGKVLESWESWNLLHLLNQIGGLPENLQDYDNEQTKGQGFGVENSEVPIAKDAEAEAEA